MKNETFTTGLTHLPCECGGTLEPATFREFDASDLLGVPVILTGVVLGMTCPSCGARVVGGSVLEHAAERALLHLLENDRRLSGREARFLRKGGMGTSQTELATRLGVSRATVARWESARSLTAEEDFRLRGVAVGALLFRVRLGSPRWKKRRSELVRLAELNLRGARQAPAPSRPPPLRIAA
jgi:transcriptional regulator with XRE-family HTH domain